VMGQQLIEELSLQFPFQTVLTTRDDLLPPHLKASQIYQVTPSILKKVTGLDNEDGIAAEICLPPPGDLSGKQRILALDGVSDPGNLGTLLRSALALGWEAVFITDSSVDPFNDKAIRAAQGATFRLPLAIGPWEQLDRIAEENRMEIWIADAKGKPLQSAAIKTPVVLVLGHEAKGVSSMARSRGSAVAIPMKNRVESLNVAIAGALLMYGIAYGKN
jgi:RNA methyltransferase, TrmH family